MADAARSLLTELRHVLLAHHKALLDSERARYDHDVERIKSSGQLLNLALHDPFFAWLHELSELIVMIDERSEEHTSELQSLRHLVCRLLLEKKKKYSQQYTVAQFATRHCSWPWGFTVS